MTKVSDIEALLPAYASPEERQKIHDLQKNLKTNRREKAAVIVPPTEPGSLGDEAMLQALTYKLRKAGFFVDLMVKDTSEDWSHIDGVRTIVKDTDYLKSLPTYSRFYLIGADVLDGYYSVEHSQRLLWLTYVATVFGLRTTIVGFSFNRTPVDAVIASFTILPKKTRICLRDALSLHNFETFVGRKATLVADMALLLSPSLEHSDTAQAVTWLKARNTLGQKVVGINISQHSLIDVGFADANYNANYLSGSIRKMLTHNKNLAIALISHDSRPIHGDIEVLDKIHKKLDGFTDRVLLINSSVGASGIKAICKYIDVILGGRMHLAIAAMGSGTPVASIIYQDKFEGLYKHFRLTDLTYNPRDVIADDRLEEIVIKLLRYEKRLRYRIRLRLPFVRRLSKKNI